MPLPYSMTQHPVWRSLSGSAVKVFIEMRSRFNGSNNGKIRLSLEDGAKALGMGKETVRRAQQELEEKGFVVKTRAGYFYGRQAAEWRLTDCGCEGRPPTRDWQIKKPEETGQKTKRGSETGPSKWLTDPI
jgi:biotin operon repressor